MKFSKYFMLAGAAAAMLTACSSEEPLAPNENAMTAEIANSDTYALISVALPDQTGTRAVEFEDTKIESEYQVFNGTFLLFETTGKTSEDDATFVTSAAFSAYWQEDAATNISRHSTYQLGFRKGIFEEGKTYAGCVVLNTEEAFTDLKKGDTFGAWRKKGCTTYTIERNNKTYMTMTSAPMAKKGEGNDIIYSTLVEIPSDNVKPKKTDLTDADIITGFYVQRNAAKITVEISKLDPLGNGDKIEVKGWAVNKKATEEYNLQNVKDGTFSVDLTKSHMTFLDNGGFKFAPSRINWGKFR